MRWPRSTDPEADPDRRAWHRAHAAAALDEEVAAELERSAERARRRGGVAAAAAFLQRAVELTPGPARRGERALAAAGAKLEAGGREAAEELLATAELAPLDEAQGARLQRLRAQVAFVFGRGSDGPPLLVDAARRLEPHDPALARDTYLEALGAAMYSGRLDADSGVAAVAEAAAAAPVAPPPPRPVDLVLDGLARRCTEGPAAGVPLLEGALRAVRGEPLDSHGETMRWLLLTPILQSVAVFELWDDDAFHSLATRALRLARDTGALALLPVALDLPVRRARVRRGARCGLRAHRRGRRDRGRDRQRGLPVRGGPRGRVARRRGRGHGADRRRSPERGGGEGAGPGRLCDRDPQQRPGPLRSRARRRGACRRQRLGLRRRVAPGARRGGSPLRPARGRRRRAVSTGGAGPRGGHGLGARRPRPLAGAGERGGGGGRALPGGDRAARAHPDPRRARSRPPALRGVAAARGSPSGRAGAAARRPRDCSASPGPRHSPSAPAAS